MRFLMFFIGYIFYYKVCVYVCQPIRNSLSYIVLLSELNTKVYGHSTDQTYTLGKS